MENRIISITEKVPQKASLPDGYYNGTWGGSIIEVCYQGRIFELETQEGIRGSDVKVVVEVKNGIATFDRLQS